MFHFTASLFIFCAVMLVGTWAAEPFSMGIRDSVMICHSFKGEEFGPAQNLHGATFTVDVDFSSAELQEKCNWVLDMERAKNILQEVLAKYHMKNLDELYPTENTTTEFMCREIHSDICAKLAEREKFKGALRVKLSESHTAWAAYYKRV